MTLVPPPRTVLLLALILCALAGPADAVERFPQPEFETGYTQPVAHPQPPRAAWKAYLDMAVLLLGLSVAAWLVVGRRSRKGVFLLMVASLVYFGFWRKGCICPVGSLQNMVLAFTGSDYALPAVVLVFFLLPLIFALFFGRVFCAAVCPLGAAQDVVLLRPVRLPGWLEHALGLLKYVYLGAAVMFVATGAGFIVCRYDPYVAFFRRSGEVPMLIFGGVLLVVGIFIGRPYCRFLCPYGVLLGWMSRLTKWHASITPDECIQCRLCEDACPFGAIRMPTEGDRPDDSRRGIRRLRHMLLLTPALCLGLGWLGASLEGPLARAHPTVQLAEQMALEEAGQVAEQTLASEAFRGSGRAIEDLRADAAAIRSRFRIGGWWWGAFVGLVVGVKLLTLSVRRTRADYETDRVTCVSCARCFAACPREQLRLGNPVDGLT